MNKYSVAVFDLDGTILNTLYDLADALNYALEKNGYPKRSETEVMAFVGNGIPMLCKRATPENGDYEKVVFDFMPYYSKHSCDNTRPYNGICELFEKLKKRGVKIAVVTNKADKEAQNLCRRFFGDLVDIAVGAKENVPKKPSPEAIFFALDSLGEKRENAVYIGDSEVDIATAKNSSLSLICVDWGFRTKEQLITAGAEVIVSDTAELERIIFAN